MEEEKRITPRTYYISHALVTSSTGETVKGITRDIGIESIYLHIEPVFELNEPVNVEIILLGVNSQLTIRMPARVVRKEKDGVAMRFFSPLEWWPIFSHFTSYELDSSSTHQDSTTMVELSSRQKTAAFQGDLSVITIENLMQLVSHAVLSGELQLATSDNSAVFFVHEGTLVYGYLEENSMKIGQRLIEGKYITNEQLQECLALYRKESPQPKIGKILVEKGYLQQDDLGKVIKEQIKSIFFEVLSWQEGCFSFSVKKVPSEDGIFLEERIDHLILEGIVRLDSLA